MGDPCYLRRETLDMCLFSLEDIFGYEQWKCTILNTVGATIAWDIDSVQDFPQRESLDQRKILLEGHKSASGDIIFRQLKRGSSLPGSSGQINTLTVSDHHSQYLYDDTKQFLERTHSGQNDGVYHGDLSLQLGRLKSQVRRGSGASKAAHVGRRSGRCGPTARV